MSKKLMKTYSLDSTIVEHLEGKARESKRSFSSQLEIIVQEWFTKRKEWKPTK